MEILNRIRRTYTNNKIPIFLVYTRATSKQSFDSMKKIIMGRIDFNDFIAILAKDMESFEGNIIKSFGVNDLINKTLNQCK